MAIDFPNSPAVDDYFESSGKTWIFNGTSWDIVQFPVNLIIADASITGAKLASGAAVTNIGYTPANTVSPTFTGVVTLPDNTVALGAKTTGDYVASLVAGTGVTLTNNSGETATPTIAIGQAIGTSASVTFSNITATGVVTLAADPSSALQAVTKQYVDNVSAGIVAKPSVLGATVSNVTGTYYNGPNDDGVGATLTHDSNGVFPSGAGGASGWGVGKGILLKSQTNKEENGRYFVSNMGSVSTPYVLTRCGYCDEASEIPGAYIFVQDGTYAGTGWIQVVADPSTFVVGTDDINVFQFSGAGTYVAGAGIVLTDNSFSVDTTTIQARVADVSDTEIGYLNGVTSAIQTQMDTKSPSASPTFTGTVTGNPAVGTTSTGTSGFGYMGLPQNGATTGAYGIVAADAGTHIYSSATRTITIPANGTIAMPIGSTIVFIAGSGATVTIAITTDTMLLAGAGTTGSRTLAPFGMATAVKITATSWIISGNGLT